MVAFYRWALHDLLYHGIPMGATLSVASCGLWCRWALHELTIHGTPMGTPVKTVVLHLLPVLLPQIHVGAR